MRPIRELDSNEIRVLGALLEKEQTTPDHYPLTVNALIAACNQKSNRNPVTSLTEGEIIEALERLRQDVLAWRSEWARAERWSQSISRRLELTRAEKAVLTLLMLRGPQTLGELRSRSGRMHPFDGLDEVAAALHDMATEERSLVSELPRQPGQKESRWMHRLGATSEPAGRERAAEATDAPEPGRQRHDPESAEPASPSLKGPSLQERVERLEAAVAELTDAVRRLEDGGA
jgi:uncharacterized protein YceH (UPF0502 family)